MNASIENPYPKTFEVFLKWFQSEDDCRQYLEWIRWPDGFICPRCGSSEHWKTDRKLIHCSSCQHQASVTAGTVFEDTRKPLLLWFHVMWVMMAQKTGLSARNLCDTYGFGSYQTAWAWLHKLRSTMIRTSREQLSGRVEVDETYVGGRKSGKRGRGAEGKVLVLVAVEGDLTKLGRVRFRCVEHADAPSVEAFIMDYVLPGSTVVTDGLPSYGRLAEKGYDHHQCVQSSGDDAVRKELDHIHLVISLLKRWLIGTHQGAIRPEHLQSYLDEFSFRFNRRLSSHRGKLFHRLAQQSVTLRPKNVKDLYTPKPQDVGGT